jgi:hypothetical protein
MTIVEAAYLAGIVDGEGSIVVSDRSTSRPNSSRPSVYLSVCNTYKPLMDWILNTTGTGTITQRSGNSPSGLPAKDTYAWRVTSYVAGRILQQIEPFLIEKRERALGGIAAIGVTNILIASRHIQWDQVVIT